MMRYYSCPKCGTFDEYRRSAEIRQTCPTCDSKVKQELGLNFKLNGPGFYSTDNAEVK